MHYWGEQLATAAFPQSDPTTAVFWDLNHSGYDFSLPVGTPLFAAGDGTVVFAGSTPPRFCPALNTMVESPYIAIDHVAPNGQHFVSRYFHVSQIDVQMGQQVVAGQVVGLSGNTGCSLGPHLHFEISTDRLGGVLTDPYGWEGSFPDPWAARPDGGLSVWLWRDGGEPTIFREVDFAPNPSGSTARVTLTAWRWMGVNDAQNPNNEFVEVTLDPRYVTTPSFAMTGFTLQNKNHDVVFTFPVVFQMHVGQSVRVYTGPGVSTDTILFMGREAGVWDNTRECVRLVYPPPAGSYRLANASGACG